MSHFCITVVLLVFNFLMLSVLKPFTEILEVLASLAGDHEGDHNLKS